jgi:Zn-dependent peptidase ImmA (M78 family)
MQKSIKYVKPRSRHEINNIALALRQYWSLENELMVDMVDVVEHKIQKIVPTFDFSIRSSDEMGETEALTYKDPPSMRVREDIYLGAYERHGRPRFTLAHELGHFFLHEGNAMPRLATVDGRHVNFLVSVEQQAHYFAACFLMPESLLRNFDTPDEVVEAFHVSSAAAIVRMREIGTWPQKKNVPDLSFLDAYRTRK